MNFQRIFELFKFTWLVGLAPILLAALPIEKVNIAELGVYQILREVGKGGQGIVYLAEKVGAPGQYIVIKTFELKMKHGVWYAEDLRREQLELSILLNERMRQLSSVKVLKYQNAEIEFENGKKNEPVLVSDYLSGAVLSQVANDKSLLPLDRQKLGTQFEQDSGEALGALFSLGEDGIVHRDLKPGNFIVANYGMVLIDHGVAKPGSENPNSTGSPAYMPPEFASGHSFGGDLWARSMILGKLLTGRHFFLDFVGDGASPDQIIGLLSLMAVDNDLYNKFFNEQVKESLDKQQAYLEGSQHRVALAEFKRLRRVVESGLVLNSEERVENIVALEPRSFLSKALNMRRGIVMKPRKLCRRMQMLSEQDTIDALRSSYPFH